MEKLVSIDLQANFGFFRKPDTNNTVNLSYNIIHKPAVLGIFGAIVGLSGYIKKGELPQYYKVFKDLKIGIEPIGDEKGNFIKTNIKYTNTVGYANNGSNYLTEELTLVSPKYRVYALIDTEKEFETKLLENLSSVRSEYIPYFGKNEFTAWWEKDSFVDYSFEEKLEFEDSITIKTLFLKNFVVKDNCEEPIPDIASGYEISNPFMYFERLPKGFDLDLMQYELGEFVYSTYNIRNGMNLKNLYYLVDKDFYVQLV